MNKKKVITIYTTFLYTTFLAECFAPQRHKQFRATHKNCIGDLLSPQGSASIFQYGHKEFHLRLDPLMPLRIQTFVPCQRQPESYNKRAFFSAHAAQVRVATRTRWIIIYSGSHESITHTLHRPHYRAPQRSEQYLDCGPLNIRSSARTLQREATMNMITVVKKTLD